MPFGGESSEAEVKKIESCVRDVMKEGKSKESAIKICKAQILSEYADVAAIAAHLIQRKKRVGGEFKLGWGDERAFLTAWALYEEFTNGTHEESDARFNAEMSAIRQNVSLIDDYNVPTVRVVVMSSGRYQYDGKHLNICTSCLDGVAHLSKNLPAFYSHERSEQNQIGYIANVYRVLNKVVCDIVIGYKADGSPVENAGLANFVLDKIKAGEVHTVSMGHRAEVIEIETETWLWDIAPFEVSFIDSKCENDICELYPAATITDAKVLEANFGKGETDVIKVLPEYYHLIAGLANTGALIEIVTVTPDAAPEPVIEEKVEHTLEWAVDKETKARLALARIAAERESLQAIESLAGGDDKTSLIKIIRKEAKAKTLLAEAAAEREQIEEKEEKTRKAAREKIAQKREEEEWEQRMKTRKAQEEKANKISKLTESLQNKGGKKDDAN